MRALGTNSFQVTINGGSPQAFGGVTGRIVVYGHDGDDVITLISALGGRIMNQTLLDGGEGDDTITGGDGSDYITGGLGNDILKGGKGLDYLVESGDVNFVLTNTALSGLGSDVLTGIESAKLTGGAGDNTINASVFTLGSVTLDGGAGKDTLIGGSRNDVLLGNAGDDSLDGGTGNDVVDGGADHDTVVTAGASSVTLTQSSLTAFGNDALANVEHASFVGTASANSFKFTNWSGTANVNGGGGADKLLVTHNTDFWLNAGEVVRASGGTISFSNIARVAFTGGIDDNRFDLSGWTAAASVAGGIGIDTVIYSAECGAFCFSARNNGPGGEGAGSLQAVAHGRSALHGSDRRRTASACGHLELAGLAKGTYKGNKGCRRLAVI